MASNGEPDDDNPANKTIRYTTGEPTNEDITLTLNTDSEERSSGTVPVVGIAISVACVCILTLAFAVIVVVRRRKRNPSREPKENVNYSSDKSKATSEAEYEEIGEEEAHSIPKLNREDSEYVDVYEEVGPFRRFIQRLTRRNGSSRTSKPRNVQVKQLIQRFENVTGNASSDSETNQHVLENPESGRLKTEFLSVEEATSNVPQRTDVGVKPSKFPPVPKPKSPKPSTGISVPLTSENDRIQLNPENTVESSSNKMAKTPPPPAPKPALSRLPVGGVSGNSNPQVIQPGKLNHSELLTNEPAKVPLVPKQNSPKVPPTPSSTVSSGGQQADRNRKQDTKATTPAFGTSLTIDSGLTAPDQRSKSDTCLATTDDYSYVGVHNYVNEGVHLKMTKPSDKNNSDKLDTLKGYVVMDKQGHTKERVQSKRSTDTGTYDYAYIPTLVPRTRSASDVHEGPHDYLQLIP